MDGKGSVFGYFFGPAIKDIEPCEIDKNLTPSNASLICMFGDYGLFNRQWKVIGRIENWSRSTWELPQFFRFDEDETFGFLTIYDDTLKFISERKIGIDDPRACNLPFDSQLGSRIVEQRLLKLLENGENQKGREIRAGTINSQSTREATD